MSWTIIHKDGTHRVSWEEDEVDELGGKHGGIHLTRIPGIDFVLLDVTENEASITIDETNNVIAPVQRETVISLPLDVLRTIAREIPKILEEAAAE